MNFKNIIVNFCNDFGLKSIFTNNNLGYANQSYRVFMPPDGFFSSTTYSGTRLQGFEAYTGAIRYDLIGYRSSGNANIFCVKR